MEAFIHRRNLERFPDLLDRVIDEERRAKKHLLADQEAKEAASKLAQLEISMHLSVWEWLKLVSTALLLSLAATSAMAAVVWFVS